MFSQSNRYSRDFQSVFPSTNARNISLCMFRVFFSPQIRCLGLSLSDLIHMHTNVCDIPSIYDIHYFWYYIHFVASLWKGEALIKYQAQSVHCRRGGEPFPPKKCLPMRACGRVRLHRYMIIIMTYQ
jgi:hypothetical protein